MNDKIKKYEIGQAEQEADESRKRFEDSAARLGEEIENKLIERISTQVKSVQSKLDEEIHKVQTIAERVKDKADETIKQVDHTADKFESVLLNVRQDVLGNADQMFNQFEGSVSKFRENFNQGTQQIRQMVDQAEKVVENLNDPTRLVSEYPRLAISVLLFGGIMIGMFFRNGMQRRNEPVIEEQMRRAA